MIIFPKIQSISYIAKQQSNSIFNIRFIGIVFIVLGLILTPLLSRIINNPLVQAAANDITFAAGVVYTVQTTPAMDIESGPVSADFNSDNHIDLVVANANSDSVSILIGNGDGTFDAAVNYTVGDRPTQASIADLDNDNDIDIVTGNNISDNVSVLLNNGSGVFATAVNYATADDPFSPARLADLDNDNDIDITITNSNTDNVSVLLNNGSGVFATASNYTVGGAPFDIAVAYINNDSYLDLVAIDDDNSAAVVFINDGDGTFAAAVSYSFGVTAFGPYMDIILEDLNGDGKTDIATGNLADNNVGVLINNGNGTFVTVATYNVGDQPYGIESADVDHDNDLDLITTNESDNTVSILLNNGTAVFTTAVNYGVVASPYNLKSADLNNDNNLDLIVPGYGGDGVSVLQGNGDGTFNTAVNYSGTGVASIVAVEDFNEDGLLDFAVAGNSSPGAVNVFINTTVLVSTPNSSSSGSKRNSETGTAGDPASSQSSGICWGYSETSTCTSTPMIIPRESNPVAPSTSSPVSEVTTSTKPFIRNLGFGSIGEDVKRLQQFLNQNNFILANSGYGSPGKETTYYGPRTTRAITRFQNYYKDQILTPLNLNKGTGYFGEKTRSLINSMIN